MTMAVRVTLHEPALMSYRDYPELKKFLLDDVQRSGKRLGSGAFGVVEEITIGGTLCAGKILHAAVLDPHNDRTINQYVSACKLMLGICHSNIVPFMGLCLFDKSANPALVMEKLDFSFESALETYYNLPFLLILKSLTDIINGLIYMHSQKPPIIHHDLTARNILINKASMCAKIADLSNALMTDPMMLFNTLIQSRETMLYMPPEAFCYRPNHDTMLDMFSFGHLALYALLQEFPGDLLPPTYSDSLTKELKARSEVERREKYIKLLLAKLTKDHVVTQVILQCLNNSPEKRYNN